MLYTRKGDTGTTKTFDAKPGERISKASCRTEALGAMDELNSFLGLCKVKAKDSRFKIKDLSMEDIVHQIQQSLFIVQAELAGAPKTIEMTKVENMEKLIDAMESEMPPIKTFFISGGTELAALFDVSRTLARKAERGIIRAVEDGEVKLGQGTLSYVNRLSSLLYGLARLTNYKASIKEEPPTYI